MFNTTYKIVHYAGRPWYNRRYDAVYVVDAAWIVHPHGGVWVGSFWTARGARRFINKRKRQRSLTVID